MQSQSHVLKLLCEIHHENVSINNLIEFRKKYPSIQWTEIIYKKTGDSILHVASRLGREVIVNYILNNWPPKIVDIKNNDCKTSLHEAAQFSQPQIVNILLKNEAQIDAIKRADWTPLMLACTKPGTQSLEIVSVLLENGANCQLVNKDGWTPLHLACRSGDTKIVQSLLTKLSVINLNELRTKNGRTILHIACLHGNIDVVTNLLNSSKIDLNLTDNCGNTPFHDAVCSNKIETIKKLVLNGASIKLQNKMGLTAVHLAAAEGLLSMLRYLLSELSMDPNIVTPSNMTALHYAARKKQIDVIQLLKHFGADCYIKDIHGRTYDDYLNL